MLVAYETRCQWFVVPQFCRRSGSSELMVWIVQTLKRFNNLHINKKLNKVKEMTVGVASAKFTLTVAASLEMYGLSESRPDPIDFHRVFRIRKVSRVASHSSCSDRLRVSKTLDPLISRSLYLHKCAKSSTPRWLQPMAKQQPASRMQLTIQERIVWHATKCRHIDAVQRHRPVRAQCVTNRIRNYSLHSTTSFKCNQNERKIWIHSNDEYAQQPQFTQWLSSQYKGEGIDHWRCPFALQPVPLCASILPPPHFVSS